MKKISLFILAAGLLLQGCMPENSVSPVFNSTDQKISWLENAAALSKDISVEQEIDGRTGGVINYNLQVANLDINGTLTVPRNSFDVTMNITSSFSNRTTTQTFGPSPFDFNKALILTLEYRGVDLRGVNPSAIDFYYLGSNGEFVRAEYSSIVVDPSAGTLKVVDAKLNHFSRWGWAKATDE